MESPLDRYYTIMIVPEKNKEVKSIKIPRLIFKSLVFLFICFVVLLGILTYDYIKVLSQVYENKHLLVENRQLKEQVQLFQMKMNAIVNDLERINIFERKLRAITGLEEIQATTVDVNSKGMLQNMSNLIGEPDKEYTKQSLLKVYVPPGNAPISKLDDFESDIRFKETKNFYENKITQSYIESTDLAATKEWVSMTRKSLNMAPMFAEFDYKYDIISDFLKEVELRVHRLDEHLLDKESFLKSTPTIMPTKGYLTSNYGPRMSPTAGRIKMHEGIDIGAPLGTTIVTPADGVVTYSGPKPGFGNLVQIDHGYGVETIYGHMSSMSVTKGTKVKRGDKIAAVGNIGWSTGPHLHYEVRVNGTPVDPLYYTLN